MRTGERQVLPFLTWLFACRKPCLILKPQAGFSIRLIPTLPPDALPLAKLAPERNSLRLATAAAVPAIAAAVKSHNGAKGQKRKREQADLHTPSIQEGGTLAGTPAGGVQAPRQPTPHYNTSIITDMLVEQHQQVLQSAFDAVPRLREAIVLLKVHHCAFILGAALHTSPRAVHITAGTVSVSDANRHGQKVVLELQALRYLFWPDQALRLAL